MKRGPYFALLAILAAGCSNGSMDNDPGAGGAGGQVQSGAGGAPASCDSGSVSFQLNATPSDPLFVQEAYPSCAESNWLKIFDMSGTEQRFIFPGSSLGCGSCTQTVWSDICTTTNAEAIDTASWTWDGHRFGAGSCGAGATCVAQECAPAGQYYVAMCASADPSPTAARRCAQVAFSYPTAAPVVATLPPAVD
jgi:hypothetical protein